MAVRGSIEADCLNVLPPRATICRDYFGSPGPRRRLRAGSGWMAAKMTRRVSEDDAAELADCYRALAPSLLGYAMVLTRGERVLAEDVVQEAFQAAALRWAKVQDLGDDRRMAWLKVITRNKVCDAYRRRQTRLDKRRALAGPATAGPDSTHEAAMMRIAGAEFWLAVGALPPRQRMSAVMRFVDEMTIAAIAGELGVSAGTVSSDLKKVREALRDATKGFVGPE